MGWKVGFGWVYFFLYLVYFWFSAADESNNLSNSTLRRKLFEGILDEDDEQAENEQNAVESCTHNIKNQSRNSKVTETASIKNKNSIASEITSPRIIKQSSAIYKDTTTPEYNSGKENVQPTNNTNITPGAIMLTPTAKSVGPTPDRSVSKKQASTISVISYTHLSDVTTTA